MIAITLWSEKREPEKYGKEVFPKVEQILQPFMAIPVVVREYKLETNLCQHFVEALHAVVQLSLMSNVKPERNMAPALVFGERFIRSAGLRSDPGWRRAGQGPCR